MTGQDTTTKEPIEIKNVVTCSYCDVGVTHIIDPERYPNDIYAEKTEKGDWKCGNCIDFELQKKIVNVIPDSQRAKEIIAEEEEDKVRKWNKTVSRLDKVFGAGVSGLELKKNRFTS